METHPILLAAQVHVPSRCLLYLPEYYYFHIPMVLRMIHKWIHCFLLLVVVVVVTLKTKHWRAILPMRMILNKASKIQAQKLFWLQTTAFSTIKWSYDARVMQKGTNKDGIGNASVIVSMLRAPRKSVPFLHTWSALACTMTLFCKNTFNPNLRQSFLGHSWRGTSSHIMLISLLQSQELVIGTVLANYSTKLAVSRYWMRWRDSLAVGLQGPRGAKAKHEAAPS